MSSESNEPRRLVDVDSTEAGLKDAGYVCDRRTAVAALLMDQLERPLLIEGPSGVGKTALARALSEQLDRPLIRLQCYEGLDESRALFEWEYGKQLLYTQLLRPYVERSLQSADNVRDAIDALTEHGSALFDERFLLPRPLLAAITAEPPALLLVDEVDRADPEFEALLLEVLSEYQVSIPELGTVRAKYPPRVILTSNATREMSEALRRRCLHLHLDYPTPARELAIVQHHLPDITQALAEQVVQFVANIRRLDLRHTPSVAETLDWARTLVLLSAESLEDEQVQQSLASLAKHQQDLEQIQRELTA